MAKLKMLIATVMLFAMPSLAIAQNGLWPNLPIVGGAAYSCGSVNGVSNCTVPAGPTAITGNENIPANTNLSGGRSPQNVLLTPASLNALPVTISAATLFANAISASSLSGGIFLTAASTISQLNVTLPPNPVDNQQYVISANRTITTLNVTASPTETMGANTAPTVMTASLTAPQGYRFIYGLATDTWFRLQ